MANKPQINYFSRDFESIKSSLVEYAQRFYPNNYKDFTEATLGSFFLDAMAYIGDTLSFQLDYQANENLISTAINRDNVLEVARQMGWKNAGSPSVTGFVTVYIKVPATIGNLGPDRDYLPVLKKNTLFSTDRGAVYSLLDDIDFADANTEFVVAEVSETTGAPTYYAARQKTKVISGVVRSVVLEVPDRSDKTNFYTTTVSDDNIIEIISVLDLESNEYYQVEALAQNLVYKAILNEGQTSSKTIKVMKPFVAARRFLVDFRDDATILTFGNGKEDSSSTLNSINDPTQVVLQKFAKDYVSTRMLDPTVINENDKFGIGPSNTQLSITYRANTIDLLSAGRNEINSVSNQTFVFPLLADNLASKQDIAASIEVENEEPINATHIPLTNDEIRHRAVAVHYAQNRAVTIGDYESMTYRMPARFGVLRRVKAVRDVMSPRRAINLYVLGQTDNGDFAIATDAVKSNLKTWLNQYKSISDSIDIKNGRIVNFQVHFTVVASSAFDNVQAIVATNQSLRGYFDQRKYNCGESINILEVLKRLQELEEVADVAKLTFSSITGPNYSTIEYDFSANVTYNGKYIKIPEDHVFEIINYEETLVGEAL